MSVKTVIVTGANKGIGFEIARQLGKRKFKVYLTARDSDKGAKAVQDLKEDGADVVFIQLDVDDIISIKQAFNTISKEINHLDVLINNAGILINESNILKMATEVLLNTVRTNVFGPILLIQHFLPLLRKGSRVINMSSELGALHTMGSYSPAYSISKTMLNAVSRQFSAALFDKGIVVNSMCPGWVKTDMGGAEATRSVEKGAETAVWLATEAPLNLTGKYFKDRQEIGW